MLNDNFWKWFGNSKVINDDGTPMVVYHGTPETFDTFDIGRATMQGRKARQGVGFYFTNQKEAARGYGKTLQCYLKMEKPFYTGDKYHNISREQFKQIILKGDYDWFWTNWVPFQTDLPADTDKETQLNAYLDKVEKGANLYGDTEYFQSMGRAFHWKSQDKCVKAIAEVLNCDGIIYEENKSKNLYVYVVFNGNQIKSVDNNGNWSNSNNIYEQKGYHGTNANFDKFDLNKIKDWRYGYGIYFTRSKGYAQNYGNVKEYDLPEDEYLLSWEDSLDYQPETIQEALFRIWKDTKEQDKNKEIEKAIFGDFANDGEAIYYAISKALNLSGKRTSEFLNKYGIKGIDSFKGNCIVIFNPEDIKLIKNIKESIMDLTKNCFSDNFDKYTDDELADQIPVDIDYENGMYILHSDLFEIENENLETAIEECIEEHSNFGEIRDSLEFDDFDDVIWEYIAPTEELPYGRLIFTYHQTFDSQWRPSGWRPEDDDLSDWEFQDDFDENFKSLNEKLEKFI